MSTDNNDLLSRLLDEVEVANGTDGATESATATAVGANPLGTLAGDPALLSSVLPALLSAMPQGGKGGGTPKGQSSSLDRHTALLCAVKPYLGERRQATAETVLKLCRLWDALSRAGISPAMLTGMLGGNTSPDGTDGEVD